MRKAYLDYIRAFAIIGVILVHVAGRGLNNYVGDFSFSWTAYPAWAAAGRVCVILFLLLSGATLLPKTNESWRYFFQKRWLKLLLVFCLWQLIYFVFNEHHFPLMFSDWRSLFFHNSSYHLWYLRIILFVYLLVPLLRLLIVNLSPRRLKALLFGWTFLVLLSQLFGGELGQYVSALGSLVGYGVLLLWGYYLDRLPSSRLRWVGLLSWICCMVIMAVGLVSSYTSAGWFNEQWHNNLSPLVFFGGLSLFYFFAQSATKLPSLKIITSLSRASFGIYLIHALFWETLNRTFWFNGSFPNEWLGVPLTALVVLSASWLAVIIYQLISTRLLTLLKKRV
jgi:surface polysaccharide O-acyltransferase-like enzyme